MPTLVIKGPDGSEQEQDFADSLTVGRAAGNDLVLEEGGVSRKHARFFVEGDELQVEDLGSANGTLVDGERIEGPTPLKAGAVVVLGDYEVTLKVESRARPKVDRARARPSDRATRPLRSPSALAKAGGDAPRATKMIPVLKGPASKPGRRPARAGSKGPTLRGLSGVVSGSSFPLAGVMVVGRVASVDLRLDDDSVSRRHAELEVRGGETVLRELGSANGTTVNGAPLTEETPLQPGDIVQFGVVELMYENGEVGGRGEALARAPARAPRRHRAADDEPVEPVATATSSMDPRKKRLFLVGGGVLAVLFVAVLVKGFSADGGGGPPPQRPAVAKAERALPADPADQIDELLKVCRTFASCEGREPDWARAEAACAKIIELEPIHEQANELMKRITHERAAEQAFARGKELAAAGRRTEALEAFGKVRPLSRELAGCYFLQALSVVRPVVDEEKKALASECKAYVQGARWENALKACEAYMRLACQAMTREELSPPYPKQLKLDGALGPNDWRPTDSSFVNFLKARQKLRPGDAPWTCPEVPVFRPPPKPEDPVVKVLEEFKARYAAEPEIARALGLYFKGAFAEARIPLQRILETVSKAKVHDEARELLLDVDNAASFFRTGQTELSNDKPEKAEEPFRKALVLDEELVLGPAAKKLPEEQRRREATRRASFVRKGIVDGMGTTCYAKGKLLADKQDFRAACRVWKLGISFNKENPDLLKAGYFCSQKAGEAFKKVDSCPALGVVLDLAVDGDGYKDKVAELAAQNGCE
jgi:pSer/pThr/pTyr-binding forkhead associated (FHA) protein/tetratricopeptide (TPR) repeat protein